MLKQATFSLWETPLPIRPLCLVVRPVSHARTGLQMPLFSCTKKRVALLGMTVLWKEQVLSTLLCHCP